MNFPWQRFLYNFYEEKKIFCLLEVLSLVQDPDPLGTVILLQFGSRPGKKWTRSATLTKKLQNVGKK